MSKMIDAEENQKADGEPQDRGDAELDALMAAADDGVLTAIKSTVDLEAGIAHVLGTIRVPPASQAPAQAPVSSSQQPDRVLPQTDRRRGNSWPLLTAGALGSAGAAAAVALGIAASSAREAVVAIVAGSACALASLIVVAIGVAAYATAPATFKAASAGRDASARQKSEKQCRP